MFLRIAADRRGIRWNQGTGIMRYRDNLSMTLARLGVVVEPLRDGDARDERPVWADLSRILGGRATGIRSGTGWYCPDLFRAAQRHFSLTGRLLEIRLPDPPRIAHWSHPQPVRLVGAANLYTVHDLIPIDTPCLTGMSRPRHLRLLNRLVDRADHLVTVSETVRQALRTRFGLGGERVTCCYQAVEVGLPGTLPPGLEPGGYFLVLGRVESRKNIARLIRAHRSSRVTLPLVLAGPDGIWSSGAARREVDTLLGPQVIRFGWQTPDVAAALIAGARAVLMPSLAEGFGLPAIEAMRFGVPSMVASIGAAAEIAGDAAWLVDPYDEAAIASGIAGLHRDEALRTRLVARGHARASDFGIESFAARLVRLYERFF